MNPDYVQQLINVLDNNLMHYESDYYDPAKAHEYYMKNRKLKGRSTSGLSDTGKDIWTDTKSNIDSEKKSKIMEAGLQKEIEIQNLRTTAETTRTSITNKLKGLSDALNAKYKTDSEGLSKEQKAQLESIARKREQKQEQIQKTKQRKLKKINEDDSLSTEEKQSKKADISEDSSKEAQDVKEEYSKKTEDTRSDISKQRQKLSSDKKTEATKNSEVAKTERTKVAADLKGAIQKARDMYSSKKTEINTSYEDIYQQEYDKIKSQYQSTKKRK